MNLISTTSIFITICCLAACSPSAITPTQHSQVKLQLFPDYDSVTIPVVLAPINFAVQQKADGYSVEFINARGEKISITSQTPDIIIPESEWHDFVKESGGSQFSINISLLNNGQWCGYQPITCYFATESIDSHIVYRLLHPGYVLWNKMGIYQRELASFDQSRIIDNTANDNGCMNCHTFSNNSAKDMMLHIRKNKGGTVIIRDGKATKFNTKVGEMYSDAVYSSWSRDGKYIAFSVNETKQVFHMTGDKAVDVYDSRSDIVVLNLDKQQMVSDSAVYQSAYWETFPEWSHDGRQLYFCRADTVSFVPGEVLKPRYNLCRVDFNNATGRFAGEVEVLFRADSIGKSVSFPKISPDGRFLVFTLSDYGNFSIWHQESDLWLMDLADGSIRAMDQVNSSSVDSYHCWSSNGSWLLFSSKRMDGRWARPYIAYFDKQTARFGKPFAVPQSSAHYYIDQMYTYNIPQFVNGKVELSHELLNAISQDPVPLNKGYGL